jgi:hypothetical protein
VTILLCRTLFNVYEMPSGYTLNRKNIHCYDADISGEVSPWKRSSCCPTTCCSSSCIILSLRTRVSIFQVYKHSTGLHGPTRALCKKLFLLHVINYNTYSDNATTHHTPRPYKAEKHTRGDISIPSRCPLSAQRSPLPRQPYTYAVLI